MQNANWLSILIATLIPILIGFIYYHKNVFGNAWMSSLGMTPETMKKPNMVIQIGGSIIMAFLLSLFVLYNVDGPSQEGHYDSFQHGAVHGLILALMAAMPIMVINALFEQRNFKNMLINIGFWTITLTLMGGVLDAMNHLSWPDYIE
jgi:hypothetical protein